jgi:hypothetical protein
MRIKHYNENILKALKKKKHFPLLLTEVQRPEQFPIFKAITYQSK